MTILAFLPVEVIEIGFMDIPESCRANLEANVFCIARENNGVLDEFLRKKGVEIVLHISAGRPELTVANVVKVVDHDDDKDTNDVDIARYYISKEALQGLGAQYAQGQEYSRGGASLTSLNLSLN